MIRYINDHFLINSTDKQHSPLKILKLMTSLNRKSFVLVHKEKFREKGKY